MGARYEIQLLFDRGCAVLYGGDHFRRCNCGNRWVEQGQRAADRRRLALVSVASLQKRAPEQQGEEASAATSTIPASHALMRSPLVIAQSLRPTSDLPQTIAIEEILGLLVTADLHDLTLQTARIVPASVLGCEAGRAG